MAALSRDQLFRPTLGYSRQPTVSAACRRNLAAQRVRSSAEATLVAAKTEAVHSLSSDTYESFIAANDLVLVDYYTDWCGPCKMIAPYLEEMAQQLPQLKFAKLNCSSDPAAKKIAIAQGIKALPTFHMFRNSERVGILVGGKPQQLRKFVEEYL
eukprot:GHRR01000520.1.p2 GENE.GHRR01000520.1~~GHRR01000520.1.p2  ORF type:complete len:181 (+),score=35.72 GHRR01000520.1:79-543(+)